MLALVDGDLLAYSCGYAAEHRTHTVINELGEPIASFEAKKEATAYVAAQSGDFTYEIETKTTYEPLAYVLYSVKLLLHSIRERAGCDDYVVVLSGPTNFREAIATQQPYKGNRWSPEKRAEVRESGQWIEWLDATEATYHWQPKPYHFDAIRDYLISIHEAIVTENEEADDRLGILQMRSFGDGPITKKKAKTVLCSFDKDLMMIPGWHYDWQKSELSWIGRVSAIRNFYSQLLVGDRTDNVVGLRGVSEETRRKFGLRKTSGVGPGSAEKILRQAKTAKEMEAACLEAYIAYHATQGNPDENIAKADMLEQGRLLWIRRKPGELWNFSED